jgi:condensin complex subunit 1
MDNSIFRKLQDAIEHPCRSRNWFGMAEQAINTIYALGDRPDRLCNDLIKKLTIRAFTPKTQTTGEKPSEPEPDAMDEDPSEETQETDGDVSMQEATQEPTEKKGPKDLGDTFELSQLLFVVGHVAIKHIVFLELVEREWKRQKDEKQAGESHPFVACFVLTSNVGIAEKAARAGSLSNPKDGEELDQVAGNAEDEIGDRIAAIREVELLYGPESLLEMYGPMLVHICRYSQFKVGDSSCSPSSLTYSFLV